MSLKTVDCEANKLRKTRKPTLRATRTMLPSSNQNSASRVISVVGSSASVLVRFLRIESADIARLGAVAMTNSSTSLRGRQNNSGWWRFGVKRLRHCPVVKRPLDSGTWMPLFAIIAPPACECIYRSRSRNYALVRPIPAPPPWSLIQKQIRDQRSC